jgi:hypothetical protein
VLALKGGFTERRELLARKAPGTAGQAVAAAVPIGDLGLRRARLLTLKALKLSAYAPI